MEPLLCPTMVGLKVFCWSLPGDPGEEFWLVACPSFSALLPVEVAFRGGLSTVSPQRKIKLKTKTYVSVTTKPNLWNSKNATSRTARRVLVSTWMAFLTRKELFINKLSCITWCVDSLVPFPEPRILLWKRPATSPGSKLSGLVSFDSDSLRNCLFSYLKVCSHWHYLTQMEITSVFSKIFERCSHPSQEPSWVLNGSFCQSSTAVLNQVRQKHSVVQICVQGIHWEVMTGRSLGEWRETRQ